MTLQKNVKSRVFWIFKNVKKRILELWWTPKWADWQSSERVLHNRLLNNKL